MIVTPRRTAWLVGGEEALMEVKRLRQDIDYNKPFITGKDLQPWVVAEKFLMWDYVVDQGLLESPDEKTRDQALLLLEDPTVYQYAFFENDQGRPFRYEPYQDAIVNCKYDFKDENSPERFVLFRASNQIGKTATLIGQAKMLLFTTLGRNIVIVTNNLKLSQFILSELKASLNTGKFSDSWREDIGDTDNTTMLTVNVKHDGKEFTNRIIIVPAGEGSLGYPVHYLFLDELDFYEDGRNLFWKVFYPRLNKTKGQCFVFSNPNPDIALTNSILYELWNGDLFKRKFHFNYLDASWNTPAGFETARRNSPAYIFASTHLGEWSDLAGSFFTTREIEGMFDKTMPVESHRLPSCNVPVFIGMDLGKMKDQTVITIGYTTKTEDSRDKYDDLTVIHIEGLPLGTNYEQIVDRYKEIKAFYDDHCAGVNMMAYDATGQKTFEDLLRMKGIYGYPVDFSKKETNKTLLYNDFKLMAENHKLRMVYHRDAERQLSELQFKYTENKRLQVENRSELVHDDYPSSLAVLIHIAIRHSKHQTSIVFIEPHGDEKPPLTTHEAAAEYYAKTILENNSTSASYDNTEEMVKTLW
jgi:phage terminase large subunit-like protein